MSVVPELKVEWANYMMAQKFKIVLAAHRSYHCKKIRSLTMSNKDVYEISQHTKGLIFTKCKFLNSVKCLKVIITLKDFPD